MGKCSYRRMVLIRDRRPTADHRMGIHPQLANADLAVYGDLAVGRVVILNNPPAKPNQTEKPSGRSLRAETVRAPRQGGDEGVTSVYGYSGTLRASRLKVDPRLTQG